jgi:Ig-like domain from next to BRCA1 gene
LLYFLSRNLFLLKNNLLFHADLKYRCYILLGVLLVGGCAAVQIATPAPPVVLSSIAPTAASSPVATAPIALAPTASPTLLGAEEPARPTTTPACEDNLKFIADLTVPDGTIAARGALIDKRWQVENNGSCNWDDRYRIKIVSGAGLGFEAEQALYPARSGASAVIRMLLLAPSIPGTYRSAWQAVGPTGDLFGDIIYVEIRVN